MFHAHFVFFIDNIGHAYVVVLLMLQAGKGKNNCKDNTVQSEKKLYDTRAYDLPCSVLQSGFILFPKGLS